MFHDPCELLPPHSSPRRRLTRRHSIGQDDQRQGVDQGAKLVWPGWNGAPADDEEAGAVDPHLRRDGRAADEGTPLRPRRPELTPTRAQPENMHIKFNVDVKVQNNPARLFGLMHDIISAHDGWETRLAPRLLIGLWHPTFIPHAKTHLPYCKRSYIGVDVNIAREFFWDHVDAFSMWFGSLTTADGEKYVSLARSCC